MTDTIDFSSLNLQDALDLAILVEDEAKEQAGREAQRIIGMAIQRSASDYISETTVSVVVLPSDEMKGRIIGREGRNIRALESVTGVNLIVDDTPEAVSVASFDPVRREVALRALEKLVEGGRIHPSSIEEAYEKSRQEVEQSVRDSGEWALLEVGLTKMHPELITLLGRLQYRTSYGQNVLNHLVESAHIAGMLAAELGVDEKEAKRAAFLHDIGKAKVDEEILASPVGLTDEQITFTDESVQEIISRYTRESGVRQLEREIGRLARKVARRIASTPRSSAASASRSSPTARPGRTRAMTSTSTSTSPAWSARATSSRCRHGRPLI